MVQNSPNPDDDTEGSKFSKVRYREHRDNNSKVKAKLLLRCNDAEEMGKGYERSLSELY